LARLARDPTERAAVDEAFRAIHTVRGDSGVMGAGQVELVCRRLEGIFEELRSGEAVSTARIVAACQTLVDHAVTAVLPPGQLVDVEALDELGACIDEGRALAKATRLGELLVNQQMVDEHDLDLALAIKSGPVGQTLVNLRAIGTDDLDQVLALQKELRRQGSPHPRPSTTHVRRVSVAEDTLQELTRAVRELQSRVVDLPTIPLMQEVVQLTERLQMQTVGALFRKLARAARALAEELEKDVWVSVAGADIEVHRELVDAMDGPLLQLVRNALDHGIERPLVRQVAGKPARATLNLHAHLMGTQLVIEVGDDGAGIDSERVLQRAIDMGLVAPGDVTSLSDEEVRALIFEPGLSATDRVGRISGRGVGMDVVETAVENAGGRITVASQRGLGTRFSIVVPQRR
ncbi:MAG: ATP-binding protein, partial [Myxococcota bacterium]